MPAVFLADEEATLAFGAQLAQRAEAPLVIFLHGDLGAGKTTLIRGFLRGLGYQDKVKSPSYTLVESYPFPDKDVFHFDFYRIQNSQELEFMGIQDYWQPRAIFLIEWPEKGAAFLPEVDLECYLTMADPGREIRLEARTEKGKSALF